MTGFYREPFAHPRNINKVRALEVPSSARSQRSEQGMRVVLAQPRGFCAGVIRAIDIVDRAIDRFDSPVYVRHEIVHNRRVVDQLKAKGARFVEELDEIPDGAVTVFSAHGVPQSVIANASERGLPVLDATCPLVTKVHMQGRRYIGQGRTLVLIGHSGHPEVEGTMGQIGGKAHLASSVADVEALDIAPDAKVAYVTQTTLSIDDTRSIISALERRFSDLVGPDTSDICYATQNRQTAVRDLCKFVDVLLVVGARNSSNSNRLREIGTESGVPSYLIAEASELDDEWVKDKPVIGLTAGASAPEELVMEVIDALRRIDKELELIEMDGKKEDIVFRLPPQLRDEALPQKENV
jgi:4-hydroxy-3-methylbut-2-enyl diphosphate reductase